MALFKGLSFSLKRALGISGIKQKIVAKTGIPTTRSGLERKIGRMTDYCRVKVVDYVPDPYYGGAQGFENVLDILEDACGGLLDSLTQEL